MLNPLSHRKILRNGLPGRATIVASSPPSRKSTTFNMAMTLQVHVEGIPPYEVEDEWWVKSADTELLGSFPLPVKVDREDHERVAIDWEQFRHEADEQKRERREALASGGLDGATVNIGEAATVEGSLDPATAARVEQVLGSFGVHVDLDERAEPRPAGADPSEDTIAKLERLQALRASGALTEEEFAEQKRRILDG